jgi:dihydropteroate synthase
MQIKINHKIVDLCNPIVMGIVNITPDSFYQGARYSNDKKLLQLLENMINDGATIIDVGAHSTRPMAETISVDEEIKRISPALELIRKKFPETRISVDTFRAQVARHVVENYQVGMINDISGGNLDPLMFETIADIRVAYVLMHTRGTAQNMQTLTDYNNVVSEVFGHLQKKLAQLHILGINDIVIDPGFGFAKTLNQNYSLLKHLNYFHELAVPLLVGLSRKSMISKTLDANAEQALNGTTALNMLALSNGASILRVHDVKQAMETIKLYSAYTNAD